MKGRIFVAEDDESICRLLEFAPESRGYEVSGFSNAREARDGQRAARLKARAS